MVSPSLQIQYAAQVALQRCLILRIDKAYLLYHFPYYLSIVLISNSIFCPTLRVRFNRYYTSVKENTLKKMQSLMVLSNKLIRVFYTILKSRAAYPMNAGSKQYQGLEELSKVT